MNIYIINPDYGIPRREMDEKLEKLRGYVGADVRLSMDCLTKTHVEINSETDAALAAPEILSMAKRAEAGGADAVVLYCMSDPALAACRESLRIPVIGGAQAACLLLPNIARRGAFLLGNTRRIPEKAAFLRTRGLDPACITDIGGIDLPDEGIWEHPEETLALLSEEGERLKACGAEAIVLGCLSFLGRAEPLAEKLGIPVIDPAAAAVCTAEAVVRMHLATSAVSYPRV